MFQAVGKKVHTLLVQCSVGHRNCRLNAVSITMLDAAALQCLPFIPISGINRRAWVQLSLYCLLAVLCLKVQYAIQVCLDARH